MCFFRVIIRCLPRSTLQGGCSTNVFFSHGRNGPRTIDNPKWRRFVIELLAAVGGNPVN